MRTHKKKHYLHFKKEKRKKTLTVFGIMLLIKFSPYIAANLTKIFLEPNNLIFKHIIPSLKEKDLYLV